MVEVMRVLAIIDLLSEPLTPMMRVLSCRGRCGGLIVLIMGIIICQTLLACWHVAKR